MSIPFLIPLATALMMQAAADDAPDAPTAESPRPVVVELFTSQGCPMCPDANALLEELGEDEDVIAIAYGVSYWNMFGWEDRFAKPEFNVRQQDYVAAGEATRVYTPHFVVNGSPEKLAFRRETIVEAVDAARPLPPLLGLEESAGEITVRLDGPGRETAANVWMVEYEPGGQVMRIEGGSNAGVDMRHYNMATGLTRLGEWDGGELTFTFPAPDEDEGCVVLVQAADGGPVLAAARLD
ncbi:DUF1223 domain-containing protein [Marinicauda salina]|nr:DUF1223 domain-containing protein [Marinicauda salina]